MVRCSYDVIVAGLGATGSSALYHVAARGKRVLGLERHGIPNDRSSYHGYTRIIRLAYYESPVYVPLLRRAYENWRELERVSGRSLLFITGSIDAGPETGWVFAGSLRSCQEHHLEYEVLMPKELHRRFPAYQLPDGMWALYQPQGGFLAAEHCVVAYVESALTRGAEVHGCEALLEWAVLSSGVRVRTDRGVYEAECLILTTGPWIADNAEVIRPFVSPERQVLVWFQPLQPRLFLPDRFPVFNMETAEGRFYGLPIYQVPGFKVGKYHHLGESGHPDVLERTTSFADEVPIRAFVEQHFPEGAGPVVNRKVCIFTNTPDGHFIIQRHPKYEQVVFASPCSGHGFKFASVLGEMLADLVTGGDLRRWPLDFFNLQRFAGSVTS